MGTGFAKKKKQAKEWQSQLARLQSESEKMEAEGSAGNGLVTVKLSGGGELLAVKIKPECVDPEDVEGLEALIKEAYRNAAKQIAQGPMSL